MHILAQLDETLANGIHRCPAFRIDAAAFQLRGLDGERGQPLSEVVVQLPRQPATFVLVYGDETPTEASRFALGVPPARALPEQRSDQQRLRDDDGQCGDDSCAMLLPHRRCSEPDFAVGR